MPNRVPATVYEDRLRAYELFCKATGLAPTTYPGCWFDFGWFDRVLSVLQANAIGDTVVPADAQLCGELAAAEGDQQHVSLNYYGSMFNHSCKQNVGTTNEGDHNSIFRASRAIAADEQLFGAQSSCRQSDPQR